MGQDVEILNLLYTGQRDAFEARLQQFRRVQLTQSKSGKINLCRLISGIVRVDGQYSCVLIEDLCNLLNDGDAAVRNEALHCFAATAHIFMFHIMLSRGLYPCSDATRDSLSDLSCALSLVNHLAIGVDASDCRGKHGVGSISELVHHASKSPVANAIRVVMISLAMGGQLRSVPGDVNSPEENREHSGATEERSFVNRRYDHDDWRSVIRGNADILGQVSQWCLNGTRALRVCINGATKSNTPSTLYRSLLAAEAATTLISHYPKRYFKVLAPAIVSAHTHLYRTVTAYETMLFRLFTSARVLEFHHTMVRMLNDAGYECDLVGMYKRSHVAASGNRCYIAGGEPGVREDDAVDIMSIIERSCTPEERLQLAMTRVEPVMSPEELKSYKAAQSFEMDTAALRFLHSPDTTFDCSSHGLRLSAVNPEKAPIDDVDCVANVKFTIPAKSYDVVPTRCDTIQEYHKLYSSLVATQMMDTAVAYRCHLKTRVILGNRRDRFDAFSRTLFNKVLLSCALPIDTQRILFRSLIDHISQMVMLEFASSNGLKHSRGRVVAPALTDARAAGVDELLNIVASERSSEPLERFLDCVNSVLLTKSCIDLGRAYVKQEYTSRMSYDEMVDMVIQRIYSSDILKQVDIRDAYVLQVCRFLLNLPLVPLSLVDQIKSWVVEPCSIRLAFSLTSNILKRSLDTNLKQLVLSLFLGFITSDDNDIRGIFLKLVSSPKGLYHVRTEGHRYSTASREVVHERIVSWIRNGGGCSACGLGPYLATELVQQCETMFSRPLWQWPKALLGKISSSHMPTDEVSTTCEWDSLLKRANSELDAMDPIDWSLLPSIWLEELFALLAMPGRFNGHPIITNIATKCLESGSQSLYEPIVVASGKNGCLVPFVCDLALALGEHVYDKAKEHCCTHVGEIAYVLKLDGSSNQFLISLISDVRKMWLDPKYQFLDKWSEPNSSAKSLVDTAMCHLATCEDYAIQLCPFISADQLESLVTHLFNRGTEDQLKHVLSLLVEVPHTFRREQKELNLALPQHFMYHCYSVKPVKDQLKRQTGLLDHCIDSCVSGYMPVESALSACTLIVESPEEVSFVFGRVLCQLVQKVTQARSVVVQSILPALFKRNAWVNKMLWRGVIICMTTLWPGHKEYICRLLLLLPPEYGEATIKALQIQHNVIAYMESTLPQLDHTVHIPSYIKMMLSL
ncbi:Symplekin tight junction protein C terminal family protein [Babesia bovis T2Bo]|uniref:Symplekin C-terminal domain-containing protein n=1 Tax=Babesia bovis TaxID=5865 RepID=A7AT77_BABBO|nr:Symplekin tight junction protein C terminal family protein [Babesia bovis T2Bo]EDO06138.1 Symplekin tight junction protein C terminal family protein [Babesia bovis T2Bo]|eukprot:XP_001609706.1 hypothetical protein [Babesia bovis T2Bo]